MMCLVLVVSEGDCVSNDVFGSKRAWVAAQEEVAPVVVRVPDMNVLISPGLTP